MKKTFIIVFLFMSLLTFGQINDHFSDGDYTSNPVWTPDLSKNWRINNGRLWSTDSIPNSFFYITTPSTKSIEAQWEFSVNLQFNTSGANYVDVYLISELADLKSTSNNGYFVRIGGTSDEISLYKLAAGTPSILINGADEVTNTSNDSLRIKVIRDASNLWTLERDAKGGTSYTLEGSITDNSFSISHFFGFLIQQSTASFFSKHFFDDIYVGNIIVDLEPPILQSIQIISGTELMLSFNEPLNSLTAQDVTNFSIATIGNPVKSALQSDQVSIKLTFHSTFANGLESELTVSNLKDITGNSMPLVTKTFTYATALFNDVVINELFPDPSPQIELPAQEFVEIYNRSSKTLDLTGWKLSDPSSTATLPGFQLLPGDYVTFTNTTGAASYAFAGKVIGLSSFPSLNNEGDKIKLVNAQGLKIDSISYSSAWYQSNEKSAGGWTLERLNPLMNTNDSTNWRASEDSSGGTPGKQNSVFGKNPDARPPQLLALTVVNTKELYLEFNEALADDGNPSSLYSVNNQIGHPVSVSFSEDHTAVHLSFADSFINGLDYSLTVSGVKDKAGNVMADWVKEFRYLVITPSVFKDVLIAEIMADPLPVVQLPEAEYIELFNRTANPFDLKDWTVSDASSTAKLNSFVILPSESIILTSTSNAYKFPGYGKVIGVTSFPSLNNDGEPLVLRNAMGELIDSVRYSISWYKDDERSDGGWSLELIDPQNSCGEEENWISSEAEWGGTPGKQNSVFANKPDLTGPKLLIATATANQLVATFNEKLQKDISVHSFLLSPEITLTHASFTDLSLKQIKIDLNASLATRTLYELTIRNLYDCAGNIIQEEFNHLTFALPEPVDSLEIVINEILFNPKPGSVDFVEIYNPSPKYINLKNFKLANFEDGQIKSEEWISDRDLILAPRAYLVFTEDPISLKNNYPSGIENNFIQTHLPNLSDDEGSVIVMNDQNQIIDYLHYTEDYHSPLIKDDEGVSLERISFIHPTNDPSNWRSANASTGYSTPGYVNSNARPESVIENGEIVITPEFFSPGSTTNNFASIQYKFEQNGYIANVKIYDHEGRSIKEISNNEAIPSEGSFRWDGDRGDGTKARNGYYLVWFEVFDLDGKVKTYRKRVVLASQN